MFQRFELGSSDGESHIDIFGTFLHALPEKDSTGLKDFFLFNKDGALKPPWKSGQETFRFFVSLKEAVQELRMTASDMLARSNVLYFTCLVEGFGRQRGDSVKWPFSGRVRFSEGKIVAGFQYADFFALFRQLGTFCEPPGEDEACDNSVRGPVERFGLEVQYADSPSFSCSRSGRIQNVSPSFLRLVGKSPESVVGGLFQDNVYFEDEMKVKELLRASFAETRKQVRVRLNHQAGGVIWVVVCVVKTSPDTLVLGFCEDTRVEELIRFQLEERTKLSRELHDGLSQDAAALWLLFEAREKNWNPRLAQRLVERMVAELENLISNLKSPVYAGKSLPGSLKELKSHFESEAGLSVKLHLEESLGTDPVVDAVVYRIVQESLTNVHKHADTVRASVSISGYGNRLRGTIKDNGKGFDLSVLSKTDRLGIKGMRERCQLYGGRFSVVSSPFRGTVVNFELPLKSGVVLE